MRWLPVIALLFLPASIVQAEMPKNLYVLPADKVRLDNGPELTLPGLKDALQKLTKVKPRPRFVLYLSRTAKFETVKAILTEMKTDDFQIGFAVGRS